MKTQRSENGLGSSRIPLLSIALATILILALTAFSLSSGITIVFQNAYYIPIILACYFYKRKGLLFSIGLIGVYFISLSRVFPSQEIFFQGLIRVLFFLLIALLVTHLSETIEREKARYKGIFSTSESGILLYNTKDLSIVEANPQCSEITGYSIRELVSMGIRDLFGAGETTLPFLNGSGGQVHHHETGIRHRDQTTRTVLISTGSAGEDTGTLTMQDISTRKRAEEDVRKSEEKFRMFFLYSSDPIIIYDLDGRILEANPAAERRFSYSNDELLRMNVRDIDTLGSAPLFSGMIAELERNGNTLFETGYRTKSGEIIPTEVQATLIRYQGTPAILSIPRDITGRKRAESALHQANKKLNLLNSITRHDILNSLTALLGFLELSAEDAKDPTIKAYIDSEVRVANNIRRQIEFTKDYQDVGVKAPAWFPAASLIKRVSGRLENPGITIGIDMPEVEIFADPLVEKVFYNLMENAVRHGKRITRIWFSSEERDGSLIISCNDDGVGIPADKKDAIFRREFFQHSGFGLFLSREILGITGIEIRETGIPGKGARFELTIPPGAFRFPDR